MRTCRRCGSGVEDRYRFCPWCAAPQRRKVVELFAPHPAVEADSAKALRISRYFGDEDAPAHVRFSIWAVDAAEAAVSLTEEEAERVAEFLHPPARRRPLLSELRDTLRL